VQSVCCDEFGSVYRVGDMFKLISGENDGLVSKLASNKNLIWNNTWSGYEIGFLVDVDCLKDGV